MNLVDIMNFITNNWTLILMMIFTIIYLGQKIWEFIALPTSKKKEELKKRLLEWVRLAESDLGEGTGVFKLAQVYDIFCKQYPDMKKWFTLEQFEELVKDALEEMEKQLQNKQIKINALKLT